MKFENRRPTGVKPTEAGRLSYCPDVLAKTQCLLAILADLDCGFEADFETVRKSDVPEVLKRQVMSTLRRRQSECRASIVRQLEALDR